MKAYKGFDENFKCRDFQFEVGKKYTQDGEIKACKNGFHACEYPLDVLGYYPPNTSRFAEVEQSGDISNDGDKTASRNIKIKAEIGLAGLIKAAVDFTLSKAVKVKGSTTRKKQGAASATGYKGAASATGYYGAASATGYYGAASATGYYGAASATGDYGAASATGYKGAASATGDYGAASATGDYGAASATGYYGAASATGKNCIAVAWCYQGKAKGSLGSCIVCSEWGDWNGKEYPFIGAKMAIVDGKEIKADTYYTLENGEFVEADNGKV